MRQVLEVRILLPAATLCVRARVGVTRCRPLFDKGFERPREMFRIGQHHPVIQDGSAATDDQGREVLDIKVAKLLGMILDIEPDKSRPGKSRSDLLKARPVLAARAAPFGTQANDGEFWGGGSHREATLHFVSATIKIHQVPM